MRRWAARVGRAKIGAVVAVLLCAVGVVVFLSHFEIRRLPPRVEVIANVFDPEKIERMATARAVRSAKLDAVLGFERAQFCLRDADGNAVNPTCVDPIVVSLLCDMSQFFACQTIAQAIRDSEDMFLLYPYEVDDAVVDKEADYTMVVTNIPGERDHDIAVLKGHFFIDKSGNVSRLNQVGRYNTNNGSGVKTMMNGSFFTSGSLPSVFRDTLLYIINEEKEVNSYHAD